MSYVYASKFSEFDYTLLDQNSEMDSLNGSFGPIYATSRILGYRGAEYFPRTQLAAIAAN
ncbi:MAG: hypothetical protein A3A73_03210 [Omnitrophica bacterium RIFCSPLOWO2_01_FULL_50_24]|nr:MAG: hypothetical protein A3A73_03210 [Omnitrophica bacterium RIFCSPLOWO2_01_FULL_50_24]